MPLRKLHMTRSRLSLNGWRNTRLVRMIEGEELAMAASESPGTTQSSQFVPPHTPTTPALTSALTIKQGNLFLLTEMDGTISEGKHVYGLYFHDCRFLCQASLRVDDVRPDMLYSTDYV